MKSIINCSFVLFCILPLMAAHALPSGARQAHAIRGSNLRLTHYDFQDICGRPKRVGKNILFKILNGTCTDYGDKPWIVQLQKRNGFKHHCGGTILTDDVIMTAAHCFLGVDASEVRVVVGQGKLSQEENEEMVFDIEDLKKHPRWEDYEPTFSNDLALIKIRRKGDGSGIQFSDNVGPACLPSLETEQYAGLQCEVSGWGMVNPDTSQYTDCLRTAMVPLMDLQECQDMYKEEHRDVTNGMMCAGFSNGGTDACSADSGGPLTCQTNGKHVLHGVVSWGIGCGKKHKPGVYTNVKEYLPWIEETIFSF